MWLRFLLCRLRLLPLTLIAASVLLLTKLFAVFLPAESHQFPMSITVAEAYAKNATNKEAGKEETSQEPAAPANQGKEVNPPAKQAAADASADKLGAATEAQQPIPNPGEIEVLRQLARRREELDARDREIDRRADLLKAAEVRIDQKVDQLQQLQTELQKLIKKQDDEQEEKLRSLVKIYENMKPKDAARIFEQLDMDTLLPVAEKMSERKLAPVMADMNPSKAKDITEELARIRRTLSASASPGSS